MVGSAERELVRSRGMGYGTRHAPQVEPSPPLHAVSVATGKVMCGATAPYLFERLDWESRPERYWCPACTEAVRAAL
jgi:hypothetical protein